MKHTNRFMIVSGILLSSFVSSCVNEMENGVETVVGEGYYISLSGSVNENGTETRAHWDIQNDQSLDFAWDASEDEMKSFVLRNGDFLSFSDGKTYSNTKITPSEIDDNTAELEITTGLSEEYVDGDVVWSVSPLNDANISDNKVTFTLPDEFVQSELNNIDHLKKYILMSGTGTVKDGIAAKIDFDVLPAIYRFKVMNNTSEELTVKDVSITGPFCNEAELSFSEGKVITDYKISDASGTSTIKVSTSEAGLTVADGQTAYLYALVFPTKTSTETDEITLSLNGQNSSGASVKYENTAACDAVYNGKDLVSNMYYDIEVPVGGTGSSVTVTDFSITDDEALQTLGYGQSYQLKYTIEPSGATPTIDWSSSDDNIVSVDDNGMLKVNTLIGGEEETVTITAKVAKSDGGYIENTVDVKVAQGRFDFSFGDGLSPWYRESSNPGESENHDGYKTTIKMKEKSSKYRADLQLIKDGKTYLDAQNYPIFAIKIALPTYNTTSGDDGTTYGNVKFEVIDANGTGGEDTQNSYEFYNSITPNDGDIAYIYYNLLGKKFGTGSKLTLSSDGPTEIKKLTFKIADFQNFVSAPSYDIYWVKTFQTEQDFKDYVAKEMENQSN